MQILPVLLALVPTVFGLAKVGGQGYQGPGLYSIMNYQSGTNADLYKGSAAANTPILGYPANAPEKNFHQLWQIVQIGATSNNVVIFNYQSGTVLSAVGAKQKIVGNPYNPANNLTNWNINTAHFAPLYPRVVYFESVGVKGAVLDLAGGRKDAGTPVLSWPGNIPNAPNQLWWLQKYA